MAPSAHHRHWIRQEAAMVAITFNAAYRKEQARKQLDAALAAYREMLDRFVSNQMRQVAAKAEQARARPTPGSPAKNVK
jgi:hypothetical protein